MQENKESSLYVIFGSILVAILIIAGSVFYSGGPAENINPGENPEIREVTQDDHILGSLDAPIKLIEYSDLECPFCQTFHLTLSSDEIKSEYIDTGKVAWVFRNFPLSQIHSKAPREAEAAECVAEIGGNEAFWSFIDIIFKESPLNNGLDLRKLPEFASRVGVDENSFDECLESGRHKDRISQDIREARSAGATGTPFSIIMKDGEILGTLPGTADASQLKDMFDQILGN